MLPSVLVLAGCSGDAARGWMPGSPDGEVTDQTARITHLWVGSWIAALAVGVLTWGLILWAIIVYRKRKGDEVLPVQLRYHVPLELLYTLLPIVMVGGLYYFTARDMTEITAVSGDADVNIQVIGKQWSWDFNYLDDDVYDTGVQAEDVAKEGALAEQPTLWLPVDEKVHFTLNSRDVIHSFWIPAFLYKEDLIPGRTNEWDVTPTTEGTYLGKCAELCGEEHSSMLFNVKVVTREEYEAHMEDLRAKGQTGSLGLEYSRVQDASTASSGSTKEEG